MAGSALHILPVQLSFQSLNFDLPALLWSSRWIRSTQHPRQHLAVSQAGCTLHYRAFPPPPPRPVQSCTTPTEYGHFA